MSRGLDVAFDFAIVACLIAALASLLRGKRYVHELHGESAQADGGQLSGTPAAGSRRTSPQPVMATADYPERAVPSLTTAPSGRAVY